MVKIKIGEMQELLKPPKGYYYKVYVMLDKDPPLDTEEGFDYLYSQDFDIDEINKIKVGEMPEEDRRFLQVIQKVDPKLYKKKYEGKPTYMFLLYFKEDVESYDSSWGRITKAEVVYDLFKDWLQEKEGYNILVGSAHKVPKRRKVISRKPILIPEEKFQRMMKFTDEELEQFKREHPELVAEEK